MCSPHNSPVHKAVPPTEAATVDEVDTFFEVLFAREESNRVGSTGAGLLGAVSLPIYGMARDKEPRGPQVS